MNFSSYKKKQQAEQLNILNPADPDSLHQPQQIQQQQ